MPMTPALQKSLLDWVNLGAPEPTRHQQLFVGLASATPTSVSAFEIGAGSGYARQSATFDAAIATDAGPDIAAVAWNQNAMTFGPFLNAIDFSGFQIWDAQVGGQMLFYGSLQNGAAAPGGTAKMPASVLPVTMG
jgi:hypothetical protein